MTLQDEVRAALKTLAEAVNGWEWLCDDPGCRCREANKAFQKAATPERILALIAENERSDTLLQQALEANDLVVKTYGLDQLSLPAKSATAIRTYLEGKG